MEPQNIKDKLKGLSLEQKQQLLKSLKDKELLKKEGILDTFKPHEGQEAFLKAPHTIRAMFSGNGFGKTTALTIDLIYTHLERHPHRDTSAVRNSWFIVPGLDKTEDYWNEIKRWCPPSQLPKPNKLGTSSVKRLEWSNGSTTTFFSHDQDSSKLEGTNVDALYIDEPPPRDLWVAAYRGLRNNKNYFIVMAGTPISQAWLYTEIYQPWAMKTNKDIFLIQGSTEANPYLSKKWIEDFKSRLTEDEVRTRLHGEFSHLQGRIFKEFSRQTHVFSYQPWPEEWPVFVALDPHPRKANTVVYLGVTPDDIKVVIDEIVLEGTPDDLAKAMRDLEISKGYKVVSRRIDNSGSGSDWSRDSFVSMLDRWSRENNYNVRVSPMRKAEKDVASSIHKIKLLFKNNQLRILDNCVHTISDLELYAWQDFRNPLQAGINEKPRKIHDDMIDPLRYIIVSNPVHSPTLHVLSTLGERSPYNKEYRPSVRKTDDIL